MLETSTNGARAAAEAAAGREDERAVGELGFVAGGRAAPTGVPDPELVEQAKRRSFTASTSWRSWPRRTRARGRARSASCRGPRACTRRI
jgi:hypothetical protein